MSEGIAEAVWLDFFVLAIEGTPYTSLPSWDEVILILSLALGRGLEDSSFNVSAV